MDIIRRREYEGAEKAVVVRESLVGTDTGTTTASFVDAATVVDTTGFESLAVTFKNTGGANGAAWKLLASIDGTNYVEVVASANVAFGAIGTPYAVALAPYRYYKVQVEDQSGGSHTTYSVSYILR